MQPIVVFTDGACSGNGKKNSKAGCGIYFESGENCSYTLQEAANFCAIQEKVPSTNNTAELLAILVALKKSKHMTDDVIIYSDSMYSIKCICVWSKNWVKNNWKTSSGGAVKNKTIIKEILERKKYFKSVIFIHVNSHTNEPEDKKSEEYRAWYGNYVADKLATDAVDRV